jgi:hypothetical protein
MLFAGHAIKAITPCALREDCVADAPNKATSGWARPVGLQSLCSGATTICGVVTHFQQK